MYKVALQELPAFLQVIIHVIFFFKYRILENNVDAFVIGLVSTILNNVVVAEVLKKLNLVLPYGYWSCVVLMRREISCFRSIYCRLFYQIAWKVIAELRLRHVRMNGETYHDLLFVATKEADLHFLDRNSISVWAESLEDFSEGALTDRLPKEL
jgi:hypothetical protein